MSKAAIKPIQGEYSASKARVKRALLLLATLPQRRRTRRRRRRVSRGLLSLGREPYGEWKCRLSSKEDCPLGSTEFERATVD
jgi:hypothetical protein